MDIHRLQAFTLLLLPVFAAGCGRAKKDKDLERRRRELEMQGKRMAEMRKAMSEERHEAQMTSYSYEGTIDDSTELNRWLGRTLDYPAEARENGIEGKVRLRFTVNKDGTTEKVFVIHSSGHRMLDEEALRVVRHLPPFGGELLENASTDSLFMLPISFKLQ